MVMQHGAWLKTCASLCRGLQSVTQLQAEEEHRANKAAEISAGKQGDIEQLTVRTDRRLCFSQDDRVLPAGHSKRVSTQHRRGLLRYVAQSWSVCRLLVVILRLRRLQQNLSSGWARSEKLTVGGRWAETLTGVMFSAAGQPSK